MLTIQKNDIEKAKTKIKDALAKAEGIKILVVGDVGLDEYLTGDVRRISPEAPVPVVEVKNREYRVGLAANVAQNIHSLGGVGYLTGIVGSDETARELGALLKSSGVSDLHLVSDSSRPTTRKVRVMSGQHHVVRVDHETRQFLSSQVQEAVLKKVASVISQCKGLIIQDYGKGVMSETLCQKLIELAHAHNCLVVVDPHRTTPVRYYRGADYIKPNRDEAFILSGLNIDDLHLTKNSLNEVASAIQDQASCKNVIVTQGSAGVSLFEGKEVTHIPTIPRQVYDVTGAGDTYLAAFCLGLFSGVDSVTSAIMANFAAGVVVGKIGSVPCTKQELLDAMG